MSWQSTLGNVGMEAEILGSLWVVDFPPCNFWIHQLISNEFEQSHKYISSYKFCEDEVTE